VGGRGDGDGGRRGVRWSPGTKMIEKPLRVASKARSKKKMSRPRKKDARDPSVMDASKRDLKDLRREKSSIYHAKQDDNAEDNGAGTGIHLGPDRSQGDQQEEY